MPFDACQPAFISLRDVISERTSPILVWSGAGMSAPAGLPTWSGLRRKLCETLKAKIKSLHPDEQPSVNGLLDIGERTDDLWLAFSKLQEGLGRESFKQSIRNELRVADTSPIPEVYELCWKLGVSGFLNLNLDRLAAKAYSQSARDLPIIQFVGREGGNYAHLLKEPCVFVANLHGLVDDHTSWIFTKGQLSNLLLERAYQDFIKACIYSRTILFIGISADDIAAGGFLQTVSEYSDTGTHFWITERTDASTDNWAERSGIRVIRYRNDDGSHTELTEALRQLATHVPKEIEALPVKPVAKYVDATPLPTVRELVREDSELIRKVLNHHAASILNSDATDKYDRYEQFCRDYDAAIYRAWHISTSEPDDVVLGYKVHSVIAQGSFGRVFRAQSPSGEEVALKVLHENIRDNPEMFQGFRRGVQSMRILEKHHVRGVVPYKEAAEIPTIAVMDFVEGPNLQQAVENRRITDWRTVLRVGTNLASIIRESHRLPDRVLHRDIRPANIMIRNGWMDEEDWEIVVLDFDLSWHRGAIEQSIVSPRSQNGYLAPEQLTRTSSASTRNAAVDSFGLGMTLFFLRAMEHPQVGQPKHTDWTHTLHEHTVRNPSTIWHSLSARYFRAIFHATKIQQSERWDVSQICAELERLQTALSSPTEIDAADLVAEELFARSLGYPYAWDSHRLAAVHDYPTGLNVTVIGDEGERRICVEILWQQMGASHYESIRKWVPHAMDRARSLLIKHGWRIESESSVSRLSIGAKLDVDSVVGNLDEHADALKQVIKALTFT